MDKRAPLGVMAALACGSIITQETLDTFHSAGEEHDLTTRGIARIEECLNNSSSLNKLIYHVKKCEMHNLVYKNISHYLLKMDVNFSISECEWYKIFCTFFGNENINEQDEFISCIISCDQMIQDGYDIHNTKFTKTDYINIFAISPLLYTDEFKYHYEIVFKISIDYESDEILSMNEKINGYTLCKDILKKYILYSIIIPFIKNYKLFGLDNVERIIKKPDEIMIICNSFVKLKDVIHLDPVNIISNKTSEMAEIYGIEVARMCLIQELTRIIPNILKCHIVLIIDVMTFSGKINSISRYTARTNDALNKISFEEAIRNITTACFRCEQDKLKTCSSCIFVAKKILQD